MDNVADVVKDKHRMVERHIDHLPVGKQKPHLRIEIVPFPAAPEIVDDQEAAREQIRSQLLRHMRAHIQRAHFEHVKKRIVSKSV